jgi:hypothetical protein
LSELKKGENHHFYGKSLSEETKTKMSEAKKGEKNHNYGKPRTQEVKDKISKSKKGKSLSEDTKIKMSKSKKGKSHSEERRRKQSETTKGQNNSAYGKKWWNDGCGNTKFAVECLEKVGFLVVENLKKKSIIRTLTELSQGHTQDLYDAL